MATEFQIEILTPGREVLKASISEAVLPAFDGERGILARHDNFIGLLGTGALKIVRDGDDYWFMISGGIYEVRDGTLTLFAETAETATEVEYESAKSDIEGFEKKYSDFSNYDAVAYQKELPGHERNMARVEVHKRTELVN